MVQIGVRVRVRVRALVGDSLYNDSNPNPTATGSSLVQRGVIVVTINYRLGVFGSLGGEMIQAESNDGSAGTFGLQDQQAALRWVRSNIARFGGDPDIVTLFGESAGAGSISAHMVMPGSRGLFHRVVIESGAFSTWASQPPSSANATAEAILSYFGCHDVACMKKIDFNRLYDWKGQGGGFVRCRYCVRWSPMEDGVHLLAPPHELLDQGKYLRNISILTGVNADEGSMFTTAPNVTSSAPHTQLNVTKIYKECYLTGGLPFSLQNPVSFLAYMTLGYQLPLLPSLLRLYPGEVKRGLLERLLPPFWWSSERVYGDRDFVCPARRAMEKLSADPMAKAYLYRHHSKPEPQA